MTRRRLRVALPPLDCAEEARDCVAQAQAAVADERPSAGLRALRRLHDLLVGPLDQALSTLLGGAGGAQEAASCAVGLLGLWRELPDIDVEREAVAELLVYYAASEEVALAPAAAADPERRWALLEELLLKEPLPSPRWWRRLRRSASGGLGDRARIQVVRGTQLVLERAPSGAGQPGEPDIQESALGALQAGDRMTLQLHLPLPGRVAVLHAAGDEREAELTVLLPQHEAEEAPRRALEIVEVTGELSAVPGASEHALLVLWVPELLPPSWLHQALARRRLPPEARIWRYVYQVA